MVDDVVGGAVDTVADVVGNPVEAVTDVFSDAAGSLGIGIGNFSPSGGGGGNFSNVGGSGNGSGSGGSGKKLSSSLRNTNKGSGSLLDLNSKRFGSDKSWDTDYSDFASEDSSLQDMYSNYDWDFHNSVVDVAPGSKKGRHSRSGAWRDDFGNTGQGVSLWTDPNAWNLAKGS